MQREFELVSYPIKILDIGRKLKKLKYTYMWLFWFESLLPSFVTNSSIFKASIFLIFFIFIQKNYKGTISAQVQAKATFRGRGHLIAPFSF